jgi:hypothetical protein
VPGKISDEKGEKFLSLHFFDDLAFFSGIADLKIYDVIEMDHLLAHSTLKDFCFGFVVVVNQSNVNTRK